MFSRQMYRSFTFREVRKSAKGVAMEGPPVKRRAFIDSRTEARSAHGHLSLGVHGLFRLHSHASPVLSVLLRLAPLNISYLDVASGSTGQVSGPLSCC